MKYDVDKLSWDTPADRQPQNAPNTTTTDGNDVTVVVELALTIVM